jgi:hypothetical protein
MPAYTADNTKKSTDLCISGEVCKATGKQKTCPVEQQQRPFLTVMWISEKNKEGQIK